MPKAAAPGLTRGRDPNTAAAAGQRSDHTDRQSAMLSFLFAMMHNPALALCGCGSAVTTSCFLRLVCSLSSFWSDAHDGLEMSISNLTGTGNTKRAKVVHIESDF